jgi:hypothetical protein
VLRLPDERERVVLAPRELQFARERGERQDALSSRHTARILPRREERLDALLTHAHGVAVAAEEREEVGERVRLARAAPRRRVLRRDEEGQRV